MIVIGSPMFAAIVASSGFSPDTVPGAIGRWYAGDYSGGTAPDATGNGNDLADFGSPPTVTPGFSNGRPGLTFGAGTGLQRTSFTGGDASQPVTIYTVNSFAASWGHIFDGGATAGRVACLNSAGNAVLFAGSLTLQTPVLTDGTIYVTRFVANGASASIRVQPLGGSATEVTGSSGSNIMRGITLGTRYTGSGELLGSIGEVIAYDSQPDASADAKIVQWLLSRWQA